MNRVRTPMSLSGLRATTRGAMVACLLAVSIIAWTATGIDTQVASAQTATPEAELTPPAATPPAATPEAEPTPPAATPPAATPTSAILTPAASAFFAPVYRGANPMTRQLETGLIKGRVFDFDSRGLAGFGVVAVTGDQSFLGFTGRLGEYVLSDLPVGYYDVRVDGYEGLPATSIYVYASSEVTIDFLESARTGQAAPSPTSTSTPSPTATPPTPTVVTSPTRRPAEMSTVVPGEATPFVARGAEDPFEAVMGIFDDTSTAIESWPFGRWMESFFLGAAVAYVAGLLIVALVNLRRR